MKTITIERYHIFGTMNSYRYSAHYRGFTYVDMAEYDNTGDDSITYILELARDCGFTHVKYTGVWRDGRQGRKEPIA